MVVWELVREAMRAAHGRGQEWLTVGEIIREVHKRNPTAHPGTIGLQVKYHCINDPTKRSAPGHQYHRNPLFVTNDPKEQGKSYRLLTEVERQAFLSNPRDDLERLMYVQVVELLGRVGEAVGPPLSLREAKPAGTTRHHRYNAQERSGTDPARPTREFSGFRFAQVCFIEPECGPDGRPRECVPQSGYRNSAGLPLHRYGAGPFCSFRIPANLHIGGVYLLTVDDSVYYVGECENLSLRFNMGYGQISPRNCYKGGQQTNCRLNRLILDAVKQGHQIDLWFHETSNRHTLERKLIADLTPPWNRTY